MNFRGSVNLKGGKNCYFMFTSLELKFSFLFNNDRWQQMIVKFNKSVFYAFKYIFPRRFSGFTTVKMVHGSNKVQNPSSKAIFKSHYPNPLIVTCYVIEDGD